MKQQKGWTETTKYMIERNEARAQLAAANERVRVLHESLRDMAQSWRNLADDLGTAPYHDGKRDALRECADDLARTFDAALAGTEPAKG